MGSTVLKLLFLSLWTSHLYLSNHFAGKHSELTIIALSLCTDGKYCTFGAALDVEQTTLMMIQVLNIATIFFGLGKHWWCDWCRLLKYQGAFSWSAYQTRGMSPWQHYFESNPDRHPPEQLSICIRSKTTHFQSILHLKQQRSPTLCLHEPCQPLHCMTVGQSPTLCIQPTHWP